MKILGINALNHDACVTLLDGKEILFAGHAERYSGIKNDELLNQQLISDAKRYGKWDKVVWFEKPWLKKTRQLYARQWSDAFSYTELPQWHLDHFKIKIDEYVKHHDSHAAAGYFTSPFADQGATILTVDAIGEWDTVSISTAEKIWIEKKETIKYPHSIGILYSAFTQRCGLKPAEEEYILMGMAAYGEPKYKDLIYKHLIDVKEDGSFKMDMTYFDYNVGLTMTNKKFHTLFGGPPRKPESTLTQKEMDILFIFNPVFFSPVLRFCVRKA